MAKPINTSVPDLEKIAKTPTGSQEGQKTVQGDMKGFNGVQGWNLEGVQSELLDCTKDLY